MTDPESEAKCPSCGAGKDHLGFLFLCGSRKTVIGFDQSYSCKDRQLTAATTRIAELEKEKEIRIKYQTVVYDACISIDRMLGRNVRNGTGTIVEQVAPSLKEIESRLTITEKQLAEARELLGESEEFVSDFVDGATDASPRSKSANYLQVKISTFISNLKGE